MQQQEVERVPSSATDLCDSVVEVTQLVVDGLQLFLHVLLAVGQHRKLTAQAAQHILHPIYAHANEWPLFFSEIGWIDVNVLFITSKNTFHPALSPGKVWTMHLPIHNGFLPIFSVLVLVGQALCCLPQALSVRYKPQNEQNTVYYCWKPQN